MKNLDIRIAVKESGLTYKAIAKEIGVTPEWLCRLMRADLSPENQIRIMTAIDRLKAREAKDSDV